ncbi:hypothetical protein TNCV_2656191 [Trichonephila clavipes]|nr:hypothetical protein TNCV_2656191 [Trichonephila clavipes]
MSQYLDYCLDDWYSLPLVIYQESGASMPRSPFSNCVLDDNRRQVRRRIGQREDAALTIAHHTGPQLGIIILDDIVFDSRTPLVVLSGILTEHWYVEDFLRPVANLLRHPGLTFQHDNA